MKIDTLKYGFILNFNTFSCKIIRCIGHGTNSIVYEGEYSDDVLEGVVHRVLIKELYPESIADIACRDSKGELINRITTEPFWVEKECPVDSTRFLLASKYQVELQGKYPGSFGVNFKTHRLNNTLYTILAYDGGKNIAEALQDMPEISLGQVIEWAKGILSALRLFHSENLLHLDIKPENIIIVGDSGNERIQLIDFNSIISKSQLVEGQLPLISKSQHEGKGYAAPEITTEKPEKIDFSTDLFSVFCVLYFCVTGEMVSRSMVTTGKINFCARKSCLKEQPEVIVNELLRILKKGLKTRPEMRYRSIDDALFALDELLQMIRHVGITKYSLFENSKSEIESVIRNNKALAYLQNPELMFPVRIDDADSMAIFMDQLTAPNGKHVLLTGEGGLGKTTFLIKLILEQKEYCSKEDTVFYYLPLSACYISDEKSIRRKLLERMRFAEDIRHYDEALHALDVLFEDRQENHPNIVLALDGYNELRSADRDIVRKEIDILSAKKGVRILLSSRTIPECLPENFEIRYISYLKANDVENVLQANGLLVPENGKVKALLTNPMMLSMYCTSAQNSGKQSVQFSSAEDLIRSYVASLIEKMEEKVRLSAQAAVDAIMPLLAYQEKNGKNSDINNIFRPLEKWYSHMGGNIYRQVFPQFTGKSQEICLGAASADEWIGRMLDILSRQLGFIIIESDGSLRPSHQIYSDYFAAFFKKTFGKVKKYENVKKMLICCIPLLLCYGIIQLIAGNSTVCYKKDEAKEVVQYAMQTYERGILYTESMSEVVADPGDSEKYDLFEQILGNDLQEYTWSSYGISLGEKLSESVSTRKYGEISMPWSGNEFYVDDYNKFMEVPKIYHERYYNHLKILKMMMNDKVYADRFLEEYLSELKEAILCDQEVLDAYYLRLIHPELTNMKERDNLQYISLVGLEKMPDRPSIESLETLLKKQANAWGAVNATAPATRYITQ